VCLCPGKGLITSKGQSAEAGKALPSKDELQNTIVGILKKVDLNTVSYFTQAASQFVLSSLVDCSYCEMKLTFYILVHMRIKLLCDS
jgi:hypothetical protein